MFWPKAPLHLGAVIYSVILFDYTQPTPDGDPQLQVWKYRSVAGKRLSPKAICCPYYGLLPMLIARQVTFLLDMKSPQGVVIRTVSIGFDCVAPQNIAPFIETIEPILAAGDVCGEPQAHRRSARAGEN